VPDLPNAVSDARLVAGFLASQGFDVNFSENLTKRGFENLLRSALFELTPDSEAVVFFAGHGFQIGSENYIVPVDSNLDTAYDVPFETVSLGSLINIIGARARLQVVILDSCRDNPFAGKQALTQIGNELRQTRTGFSSLAAPLNSILVYSTSPGSVALDGDGENSPFTEALVEAGRQNPDTPLKDLFEEVRRDVFQKTGGRQVPWESSTLIEPVSFGNRAAPRTAAQPPEGPGGLTRSVALVTGPGTMQTAFREAADHLDAALTAPFQQEVDIGGPLADALGLGPGQSLTIEKGPSTARLLLEQPDGTRSNALGATLTADDLDALVLDRRSVQIRAIRLDGPQVPDRMTVSVDGQLRTVGLVFDADPCDYEAGDHLDPDGTGLVRYANEIEPERALQACRAAVEKAPGVGRFHYQLGRVLTALRQNDEARAEYRRALELGYVRAYNALGNSILNEARTTGGQVDEAAPEEVLSLFAQGVDRGDPYAYYSLGRQFMRFGTSEDEQMEGYDLMMRALEVGHTFAMNELGYFYLDEDNRYYDPERGLRYLRESAAREDIYGYNNMGLVYAQGLGGVEKDYQQAYDWFLKAAEGGHPNAAANIGRLYQNGLIGGSPDYAEAVKWFDRSFARGDGSAGGIAAYLILSETPDGYPLYEGAVRAAKAAALRDPKVAGRAADLLRQFPDSAVDGAAQQLIAELGVPVDVDGAFGAGSQAAMDKVLAEHGGGTAETDRYKRAVQLARLYWENSPFRVDLY
jgi:TPR repeat protein